MAAASARVRVSGAEALGRHARERGLPVGGGHLVDQNRSGSGTLPEREAGSVATLIPWVSMEAEFGVHLHCRVMGSG